MNLWSYKPLQTDDWFFMYKFQHGRSKERNPSCFWTSLLFVGDSLYSIILVKVIKRFHRQLLLEKSYSSLSASKKMKLHLWGILDSLITLGLASSSTPWTNIWNDWNWLVIVTFLWGMEFLKPPRGWQQWWSYLLIQAWIHLIQIPSCQGLDKWRIRGYMKLRLSFGSVFHNFIFCCRIGWNRNLLCGCFGSYLLEDGHLECRLDLCRISQSIQ